MNGYEQILVVVLAGFLAIFLLLGIVLLIFLIQVVKSVKRISEKAEHLAERADNVSEFIEHAAAQLTIGRFIGTLSGLLTRKQAKKGKK